MVIQIINGPNLNLLGKRQPSIYGNQSFEIYLEILSKLYPDIQLNYYQSNSEGDIIECLHTCGFNAAGIILNAGAYTHTSIAIADAIATITTAVVEVHISNVYSREEFRHKSVLARNCKGIIAGFGMNSYRLALESFID